jgi:tetratricopeptide (TPR) repeat protein
MVKKGNSLKIIITTLLLFASLIMSCGGDYKKKPEGSGLAKKSFDKGNAYYKLGKIDAAIKEYEKTILYNKEHKRAHYNLGILYKEKKRYAEALHEFEEFLKYSTDEDDEVVRKYVSEEIEALKKK